MNTVEKIVKIFIDENIAPQFAQAFDIVQSHLNKNEEKPIKVLSIQEVFGIGAPDELWIPEIGKQHGVVITQDRKIQRTIQQRELYLKNNVGIIFLKHQKNGMTFWEMFKHLVRWWDDIKSIARKNKPPFAFRQPGADKKFEKWEDNNN